MLEVEDVSKSYGASTALRGVSLSVGRGEVVALLGANGAGKTTLLSLIAGLRRADSGRVRDRGARSTPARSAARHRLRTAGTGRLPARSVAANLRVFAELGGLRGADARRRVGEAAHALGLDDLVDRRAGELSGGERRRVHVAMALVHEPSLVVLDEPSAGVDLEARAELLQLVRAVADNGAAVVFSTHYLAEAEALGGRVAVLHRGRKVADAPLVALTQGLSGRVQLTFDDPVPAAELAAGLQATVDGSVLTVRTAEPERQAAMILAAAAPFMTRLRSVRVLPASLEDAYLSVTGEQLDGG